jgi:hypothetical protein
MTSAEWNRNHNRPYDTDRLIKIDNTYNKIKDILLVKKSDLCGCVSSNGLDVSSIRLFDGYVVIWECQDEWFRLYDRRNGGPTGYYICDQYEGLIKLLCDLGLINR